MVQDQEDQSDTPSALSCEEKKKIAFSVGLLLTLGYTCITLDRGDHDRGDRGGGESLSG
jgi:hypothetical protein